MQCDQQISIIKTQKKKNFSFRIRSVNKNKFTENGLALFQNLAAKCDWPITADLFPFSKGIVNGKTTCFVVAVVDDVVVVHNVFLFVFYDYWLETFFEYQISISLHWKIVCL